MHQTSEWTRQAGRTLASRRRPHFAPVREVLEVYQSHIETARQCFDMPRVLVLGATPELADLALSSGCLVYRVDNNQAMFDAAAWRQQYPDRSNETIICGDWLNMDMIGDGMVDLVMGDAAINQIPHERMGDLFSELTRITHPGSLFSLKQIVMPDDKVAGYEFSKTVHAYRTDRISADEFYEILRFYCFLDEAYSADSRVLDAGKVFSAIRSRYEAGELDQDVFEFVYARRGGLQHTVYVKTEQYKLFQSYLGDCRLVYPRRSFVYENIYNMFFISVPF